PTLKLFIFRGCAPRHSMPYRRKQDIVKCAGCGTVYLRTRFTTDAMDQFYQLYAEDRKYVALPKNEDTVANSPLRRAWFLNEIMAYQNLPGNKILDIGCSWGAFLLNARENGFEPRGIEITRKAAEYATKILGIPVTTTQLADSPIEGESISLVTMIPSLEHLPDTERALDKVYSVLEQGGLYCGMVPNIESVCSQAMGDDWLWLEPTCHYVYFSPESLRNNLERAGFVVENLYTTKGDYDRAEIEKVIRKLYEPRGIGVEGAKRDGIIGKAEANGFGEEIRFFARKPIGVTRHVKAKSRAGSDVAGREAILVGAASLRERLTRACKRRLTHIFWKERR